MAKDEETFPRIFQRIKDLLRTGKVTFSHHGEKRAIKREVTTLDIENVIRYGRIVGIRRDMRHINPAYTIEGLSVDNERLVCSVAVEDDLLIIVTAYFKD